MNEREIDVGELDDVLSVWDRVYIEGYADWADRIILGGLDIPYEGECPSGDCNRELMSAEGL